MTKPKQQTYKHFNHRYLWQAARAQWEIIPKIPDYKAKHFHLSAILLMNFAMEGYFNWLLSICAPNVWVSEKAFFKGNSYPGTIGKCCYLLELLRITDWPLNERPINTVREVDALRDRLVHPKPESGVRVVGYDFPEMPPVHVGQIDSRMNGSLMDRTKEDFQRLANRMHNEAQKVLGLNIGTAEPFCGLTGFQSTEM